MEGNQQVTNRVWLVEIGDLISSNPEVPEDISIDIFPNPSSSRVNVVMDGFFECKILNESGKLVYHSSGFESIQMQTIGWGSGVYFIEVENKNGIRKTQKLVLKQ